MRKIRLFNCLKKQILKKKFNLEFIISNDCSKDKTSELLENNKNLFDKLIIEKRNKGNGAALKSAISYATGELIIF